MELATGIAPMASLLEACKTSGRQRRVQADSLADRCTVEGSVRDSGAGIADALRSKIFRRFYPIKPNGTGLGLASCRAIVEAHDGKIGYESDPASGCRFWFRLPVIRSKGPAHDQD